VGGLGAGTKATHITNRRWALSALGTAAAAALKPGDTVYSVTPIHHSSALLMSVGGAVASGARFAMSSSSMSASPDPETFWTEVRRYGVSHVSYTWTSLHDITYGPVNPNEAYNPIRMFIGSGMPRNLWTRVAERFPNARVLEFYASAEGEAILANLSGQKPGSMGKPIPGTAEVRVASFNLITRQLELTSSGLGREALADEVGLLLTRVNPNETLGTPLRSVFQPEDAWRSSHDLFLRDDQGDHWLAGSVAEIVDTSHGPVLPSGARFCLGSIPCVDLVVAYGVEEDDSSLLCAAVTLRPDTELGAADLDKALERLPRGQRPTYVQVVPNIPLTTWHRPVWRDLQKKGVPKPTRTRQVWQLDPSTGHYAQL